MVFIPVHPHAGNNFPDLAINPHMEISFLAYLFKKLLVVPFPVSHHGRENIDFFAYILLQDQFQNLFMGIFHHLFAGDPGIGLTCTGIKKAQEIIHLSSGPHGRPGILVGSLLLNRDYGA